MVGLGGFGSVGWYGTATTTHTHQTRKVGGQKKCAFSCFPFLLLGACMRSIRVSFLNYALLTFESTLCCWGGGYTGFAGLCFSLIFGGVFGTARPSIPWKGLFDWSRWQAITHSREEGNGWFIIPWGV
ncbi:hypothetical protein B0T17DRAFT_518707 [Bombardia bombarda]|uniref:Uncharacterized protein n=1 Tax=Bombardia bombarda TaxID=252184 RepID=A0AA39XLU1_9PEZI|nr:hypothetical protein B0T17DRAFT_518707 [Bombardia bombarda]